MFHFQENYFFEKKEMFFALDMYWYFPILYCWYPITHFQGNYLR